MLKIDQIELAKLGFNPHELKHLKGDAAVIYGEAASASSEAPQAKGVFHMVNCGAATMCKIDAASVSLSAGENPKPEAI